MSGCGHGEYGGLLAPGAQCIGANGSSCSGQCSEHEKRFWTQDRHRGQSVDRRIVATWPFKGKFHSADDGSTMARTDAAA